MFVDTLSGVFLDPEWDIVVVKLISWPENRGSVCTFTLSTVPAMRE